LRLGKAFIAAGDPYIGLDLSAGMLSQFIRQISPAPQPAAPLVQANGESLPFVAASFDTVLLVHVLSGVMTWQKLLAEARRVLRANGWLILGQTVAPSAGIEAQLRRQLSLLLAEMKVTGFRPGKGREQARAWLSAEAVRQERVVAAQWTATRTPRDFLIRQATGARFAALPEMIKQVALQQLSAWAIARFGSLDMTFIEPYNFELEIFAF
jgi:SAM-dependent methyltransferase